MFILWSKRRSITRRYCNTFACAKANVPRHSSGRSATCCEPQRFRMRESNAHVIAASVGTIRDPLQRFRLHESHLHSALAGWAARSGAYNASASAKANVPVGRGSSDHLIHHCDASVFTKTTVPDGKPRCEFTQAASTLATTRKPSQQGTTIATPYGSGPATLPPQ